MSSKSPMCFGYECLTLFASVLCYLFALLGMSFEHGKHVGLVVKVELVLPALVKGGNVGLST